MVLPAPAKTRYNRSIEAMYDKSKRELNCEVGKDAVLHFLMENLLSKTLSVDSSEIEARTGLTNYTANVKRSCRMLQMRLQRALVHMGSRPATCHKSIHIGSNNSN